MVWAVSYLTSVPKMATYTNASTQGMGTLHAWESYGNITPDIQAVAKGLGGG